MKKFILTIMACVGMLSAKAQTITIENLNYAKGEEASFEVVLKTEQDEFSAVQAWMYLPTGTILPGDDDDADLLEPVTNSKQMVYDVVANAPAVEDLAGYDKYMVMGYNKKNAVWASTEGCTIFKINIMPSELDKIKVILKNIVLARPNGTKETIDLVQTGITGIAADKAEAANDGKFVENNSVVIKKAGVKYSTTGQVIK